MSWQEEPFPSGLTGRDSPLRIADTIAIGEHQGYPLAGRRYTSRFQIPRSGMEILFEYLWPRLQTGRDGTGHESCMSIDT
jgi:hypothetical protein